MRFHRQNIPFLVQQNCHGLKREPYLFACISHKRNGHQKDHRPSLFSFLVTTFNFSIQDEKKKTKWSTRCGGKKTHRGLTGWGITQTTITTHTPNSTKMPKWKQQKKKVYYIFCVCILLLVYAPTACRAFHIFEDDHWFCAKHVTKLSKQNLFFLFPFCREFSVFCFKDNK